MNAPKLSIVEALRRLRWPAPTAQDDQWITVKPNGPDAKGQPALIGEGGEIKAGMGGKFNGQKINQIQRTFENPQYKQKLVSQAEKKLAEAKKRAEGVSESDVNYKSRQVAIREANRELVRAKENALGREEQESRSKESDALRARHGKESRFSNSTAGGSGNQTEHQKSTPPVKKISDSEFETGSNFTDGVKIKSYQLPNGAWQSDVYIGSGRGANNIQDRNQHKTEAAAKKWAQNEMRIREQKYRVQNKPTRDRGITPLTQSRAISPHDRTIIGKIVALLERGGA